MPTSTPTPSTPCFSELSIQLTEKLSKDEKKNGGIFFTPPSCIQGIIALLRKSVSKKIHHILEPSCGSGEFIGALTIEYPDAHITGVEFHPLIYESVSKKFASNKSVTIHHSDFLSDAAITTSATGAPPDLIIGNPPYFVMKKDAVPKAYYPYFDGRPNIFALFIIKSAEMLQEGGILCFVLPSNFMNSSYYNKTRKYLVSHFAILHVVRCESLCESVKYIDTAQDTIVLIVQKGVSGSSIDNTGCVFEKHGMTILSDNVPRLVHLYSGSKSLAELHFDVHVGTVVWNQCKAILTDDSSKTRLIYSSNIEDAGFVHKTYKNSEKKAFIDKPGIQAPMLVLNRGYGVGEYQFDYCLITPDTVGNNAYLVENHLICITTTSSDSESSSAAAASNNGTAATPTARFQRIIRSFRDPRTKEFIECYFGNNAINTTELNHMLPIYDYDYEI